MIGVNTTYKEIERMDTDKDEAIYKVLKTITPICMSHE